MERGRTRSATASTRGRAPQRGASGANHLRLPEAADFDLPPAALLTVGFFAAAGFALVGARLEPAVLAGDFLDAAFVLAEAFAPLRGSATGLPSRSAISSRA